MLLLLSVFPEPKTLVIPSDPETFAWLWQALPFFTFVLGVGVGAALMYVPMALKLWNLRHRLHQAHSASPQMSPTTSSPPDNRWTQRLLRKFYKEQGSMAESFGTRPPVSLVFPRESPFVPLEK